MATEIIVGDPKPVLPVWARIILFILSYLILSGIFQFAGLAIANMHIADLNALKNASVTQLLILQFFGFLPLIPLEPVPIVTGMNLWNFRIHMQIFLSISIHFLKKNFVLNIPFSEKNAE